MKRWSFKGKKAIQASITRIIIINVLVCLTSTLMYAQTAPPQDCLGAIPICQDIYVEATPYPYSGEGNRYPEINASQPCIPVELNGVWYIFTAQTAGNFSFIITPNNPNTDYDWIVFDMTNRDCSGIYANTRNWMVSSNTAGNTGCHGATGASSANGGYGTCNGWNCTNGPKWNADIPVAVGNTYVLYVSNWSGSSDSYTIDFSSSTAVIFDNIPPTLDTITTPITCNISSLRVEFSENVKCATIEAADFTITGGTTTHTVTQASAQACNQGGNYESSVNLVISPPITEPGTYSLNLVSTSGSVEDICGNTAAPNSISFTLEEVQMTFNVTAPSCLGATDGSITVSPTTGVPSYLYSWDNGSTSATATGLAPGTYVVTVADGNGCNGVDSATVNPAAPMTINLSATDISCAGASDGSAEVVSASGAAPYTYIWDNGATSQVANGLAVGSYSVTVTDANGCTSTNSTTVNTSPPMTTTLSATDISCAGASDGSAEVVSASGAAPYTYIWDNGTTSQVANGLAVGSYSVTVTDANGCTSTNSATVNTSPPMTINLSASNISCAGASDGSTEVFFASGVAPYTYNWDNGATTQMATGLTPGSYSVTVTDANGCTGVNSTTVNTAPPMTINLSATNISCAGGSDGSAEVFFASGVAPYTYVWDNGATTQMATGLTPGSYSVTVTDANGCTSVNSTTVNTAPPMTVNLAATDATCDGTSDGSVEVFFASGAAPFTYVWSNGANTQLVNSISAGSYSVTVTDANGCVGTETTIVGESAPVLFSLSATNATCADSNDGAAIVTPNDPNATYTYIWSNGSTSTNNNNLTAGTYTVTVTDVSSCYGIDSAIITSPDSLSISLNPSDVSCFGLSDGSITSTTSGGTIGTGYSYSWSHGTSDEMALNLTAGDYTLTVTDANGCTVSQQATVAESTEITIDMGTPEPSCLDAANGSISPTVSGGSTPYIYNWSNGGTTLDQQNISAGSYTLEVTDNNNCSATATAQVDTINISITLSIDPDTTIFQVDEPITITVSSDDDLDGVTWSPTGYLSDISGMQTVATPPIGQYSFTATATDVNGCVTEESITVIVVDNATYFVPNAFSPNGDGYNETFEVYVNGKVEVTNFMVFDRWGEMVFESKGYIEGWDGTHMNGQALPPGVYVYRIGVTAPEQTQTRMRWLKGSVTLIK